MEGADERLGRLAYEAYCGVTEWRSAITGADLPAFYDTPDKVHAKAQYALDYHPDGTLTALLARSPKFGGKVASYDDAAAKAVLRSGFFCDRAR